MGHVTGQTEDVHGGVLVLLFGAVLQVLHWRWWLELMQSISNRPSAGPERCVTCYTQTIESKCMQGERTVAHREADVSRWEDWSEKEDGEKQNN